MGWESSDVVKFDLGPLLQGQTRKAKLKNDYNSLIIDPRVLGCETDLQEVMGRESSDVVKFDLGPPPLRLNENKPNLEVCITCLLIISYYWS